VEAPSSNPWDDDQGRKVSILSGVSMQAEAEVFGTDTASAHNILVSQFVRYFNLNS